jgi:heme a synthase
MNWCKGMDQNDAPLWHRRRVIWLFSGCVMIAIILVIGGLTRLNQAGLSITEWEVVRGAIPPLSEAQWEEVFETYRQYPEYQEIHRGMSLSEFKVIYWWEYSHRMLSRFLGALFLLPFLWFVALRVMPPGDALKLAGIALLGGVQAFLGWYMVQSGLDTQPVVSHLRLGIHLVVAFLIFSMLWTMALNRIRMRNTSPGKIWGGIGRTGFESTAGYGSLFHTKKANLLHIVALTAILLLFLQVLVGGWTAGLKAGYIYPTFPKMGDYWIPPQLGYFTPLWFDLTHNAITVQFIHRMLGLLLTIFILIPAIAGLRSGSGPLQLAGFALLLIITLQITTGALNLLWGVPVWLASLHQLGALLLLAALLTWLNLHSRTNSAIRNYIT